MAAGRGAGCEPSLRLPPPPRPPSFSRRLLWAWLLPPPPWELQPVARGLVRPEPARRRGAARSAGAWGAPLACLGSDNSRRGRGCAGRAHSPTEGRTLAARAGPSAPHPGVPSRSAPPIRGCTGAIGSRNQRAPQHGALPGVALRRRRRCSQRGGGRGQERPPGARRTRSAPRPGD